MKLLHLSDLHLGKRLNEFSMIEDQRYILFQILNIIDENLVNGVIIAGDIYDKSVPTEESVMLFDTFLTSLSTRNIKTFIISGNHDSPERVSFCSQIMSEQNIYISPVFSGKITKTVVIDEFGELNFYLLPFVKMANVKRFFPDEEINSITDALQLVINNEKIDFTKRNIIISHQFVTGAIGCDSEEVNVGGADNVDAAVFDGFDYVALGHIHNPQTVSKKTVRYCGTPLKYSFSESKYTKFATLVSINEKGSVDINEVPLVPKHEMREIKGTYDELTLLDNYKNTNLNDYLHVILTDEDDVPDAIAKLRSIYENIMKLTYDNNRTRGNSTIDVGQTVKNKSPFELFEEFFLLQNNVEMSQEQKNFIKKAIEEIWNKQN